MSAPNPPGDARPKGPIGYQVPSLLHRIVVAAIVLIPSFLLMVALPVAVLTFVQSRGIALPVSTGAVTFWGTVLLALGTARSILKPTAAYGPLSVATAFVSLLYLVYLVSLSPYRFVIPGGTATFSAGYSSILEVMMIVPALWIAAGVLATVEDVRAPKERLPFDYPA